MIEKDITVIGAGPGGYVAAIHAAHLGASVALIEKAKLGGTCLNHGCIPTKTLVRTVEVLHDARNAGIFGVEVDSIRVNFMKVMERKREVVNRLIASTEQLMKVNKISVYRGAGVLVSPHLVSVNGDEIATRRVIIATGSEHASLPIPGADLPGVLSTDDVLDLETLPESMIIVGGSYVGAEFATIFNKLGTKITIVKRRPLRLEPVDEEIGKRFAQTLPRQGINVLTGASVKEIRQDGDSLSVLWDTPDGERRVTAHTVLMATGRRPFTEGLDLAGLNMKITNSGIEVDEYLETSVEGIYAIGDVLGTSMLAHVASHEGITAAENALGRGRKVDYRSVPSCVFTSPPVASVGMSELDARERGIPYVVSKFPFTACARAIANGETGGLIKLVCHADNLTILGMHIMGTGADDLIAEGALAVQLGATAEDLAHTIHVHPSLSEAVHEVAMGQLSGAIHFTRI